MIVALIRAARELTQKRRELKEASAEHTRTANNLIRVADEISNGRKVYRLTEMDAFVRRARRNGAL